jgi:hypothetical protein
MDFKCPHCGNDSFGSISEVAGAQFATCNGCGKTVKQPTADAPGETLTDSAARPADMPVAAAFAPKSTTARRQAEDKFTKTRKKLDDEVKLYQQQRWDTETEKIARLRALRLARDANPPEAKKPAKRPATRKPRPGNDGSGGGGRKETRSRYLGGYE